MKQHNEPVSNTGRLLQLGVNSKQVSQRTGLEIETADWQKRTVSMSNALVSSAQALTLREKRIIGLAVSKIDSVRHASISPKLVISAKEYAEFSGINVNDAYKDLSASVEALVERRITWSEEWKGNSKKQGSGKHTARVQAPWVQRAAHVDGLGIVEIQFSQDLLPHLTMLREKFTTYQLHQTQALRSVYTWRIFELLMQYKATGWREFTVEDFAKTLELPDTYLKNFSHIKKRVIEPSVKELKAKDHWDIETEYKKKGRKVASIKFKFSRNPQGDLFS